MFFSELFNAIFFYVRCIKASKACLPFIIVWCLFSNALCAAEVYKYEDEHGRWQFTDKKLTQTSAEVVDF